MLRKHLFFITMVTVLLFEHTASARIFIPIDQPIDKKFPIAVADLVILKGSGVGSATKTIASVIRNDLDLSGYFYVVPKRAYLDNSKEISAESIDFNKWRMVSARALVKGGITQEEGRIVVQLKLFDTHDQEMLIGKQYTFESSDVRKIAHRFSDEIMLALTGVRGVFGTQIAYVSQTKKRSKSIFVMDMDGEAPKRITKDNSISLGPTWSPDGQNLTYASYVKGFPDIYVADLKTGRRRQITSNRATNITPSWSPTGTWIAFASSSPGNMEIFAMTPDGQNMRRITNAFGIDLSPSFSPEGTEIIYSSERGGNLQIYKKSLLGGDPKRLTYVGSHNDSPSWSPDGQKVAFCGRAGGIFDIFTVNIDGTDVQRLTIGAGTNEHPRWSPDGRFIVYSSTRSKGPHVFIMRYDGANQINITKKGNGMMPSWGPWTD